MSVKNINVEEFLELRAGEEIELVDVREDFEYEESHLKGAKHIPMSLVPLKLDEIDFSKKVVFYCRTGARSFSVANAIDASGRELYNLDGGIMAVEREAGELVE